MPSGIWHALQLLEGVLRSSPRRRKWRGTKTVFGVNVRMRGHTGERTSMCLYFRCSHCQSWGWNIDFTSLAPLQLHIGCI